MLHAFLPPCNATPLPRTIPAGILRATRLLSGSLSLSRAALKSCPEAVYVFPFAARSACACPLSAATLFAGDYTYQQTTQITGGSLLHMMKTVGIFSSQARHLGDPVVSTIYLKDNRLANVSSDNIQIIDLDKETITQIDIQKRTYTVMTFAQIKQAIENARAQMEQQAAKNPPPSLPSPPRTLPRRTSK